MTSKQIQEESEQNCHIFQFKLKNACTRNNSQRSQQQTKDPFPFFYANHLYLMKIALTRKNMNKNTTPRYKSSKAKKTYPIKTAK
jgi:hypothetical protein